MVPQDGLPGQKEAGWQRLTGFFLAGDCSCQTQLLFAVLYWSKRKLCGTSRGSASSALLLVDFLEERSCSGWMEMIQTSSGE